MGSGESRLYRPATLKKESWREGRARRAARPEQGRFRVLVNNLTSEQLEEYLLSFHSLAEFQRYLEFFQWREREDSIVNSKYLNYELGKDFCNTSYAARVYLERIPVRLSDIEDIPFPENLYVLLAALDGFEKLYQTAGYFRPSEDLVCMDRDGRVKAWLHPDLSRCQPLGAAGEAPRREEALETRMVDEVVRMVEENTARDHDQPLSVSEYIRRNQRARCITFRQAKLEVLAYADHFHADIPNYFESVVGIFDEPPSEDDPSGPRHEHHEQQPHEQHGQHEALEQWQSVHPSDPQDAPERLYARAPEDERPNSALYSLSSPQDNAFAHPSFPLAQPLEYSAQPLEYRSMPPSSSSLKVRFNYPVQAVPPQLVSPVGVLGAPPLLGAYAAAGVSPICHLSSPAQSSQAGRVAAIPEESERTEERFDAKLVLSSSLRNLLTSNNKLVYSDSTSTYELDEELAEDMVRYLNAP